MYQEYDFKFSNLILELSRLFHVKTQLIVTIRSLSIPTSSNLTSTRKVSHCIAMLPALVASDAIHFFVFFFNLLMSLQTFKLGEQNATTADKMCSDLIQCLLTTSSQLKVGWMARSGRCSKSSNFWHDHISTRPIKYSIYCTIHFKLLSLIFLRVL